MTEENRPFKHAQTAKEKTLVIKGENIILVRKGTKCAKHLFLIHDGIGQVEVYVEFCNNLNSNFNYWGIKREEIENYTPQNLTIENIATNHIEKIKCVQPRGFYYIAGWSLGGVIAFEIVRQLELMNEKVRFLAMFDTFRPRHFFLKKVDEFTFESELEWLQKHLSGTKIAEVLKNVSELEQLWPLIVDYLEKNLLDFEIMKKLIPKNMVRVIPDFDRLSPEKLIYYLNLIRSFDNALRCYSPSNKIKIPIHFFRASQSKVISKGKWNNFTVMPFKYYKIPGDHFSILKKPKVLEFAKIFDSVITCVE